MLSPRKRAWRRTWLAAPLLVLALTVAACGSSSTSGAPKKGGVAGTTASIAGARQVTVTETEYRLQLSQMQLQPGPTTFVATNNGHVAHSLEIDGPGVSDRRIAGTIPPGSSMQLTVTLQKGSYEIYCPVDGHKRLGMDVHVSVGGASAGGSTTPAGTTTTSGGGY